MGTDLAQSRVNGAKGARPNGWVRVEWGLKGSQLMRSHHPRNSPMKISLIASALAVLASSALAQSPQRGLTLFNPNFDQNTYLLDNNGQIVHTWNFTQNPGNTVYLEEDGTLLRSHQIPGGIGVGGKGGGGSTAASPGSSPWRTA